MMVGFGVLAPQANSSYKDNTMFAIRMGREHYSYTRKRFWLVAWPRNTVRRLAAFFFHPKHNTYKATFPDLT